MNSEFEGKLLVFRVLLPLVSGMLAAWLIVPSQAGEDRPRGNGRPLLMAILGSLTIWGAFLISDLASRGILLDPNDWSSWEAREPWMHWVWTGPLVLTLWLSIGLVCARKAFHWLWIMAFVLLALSVLSLMMFPSGQGYADQLTSFRYLGGLALVASLLNVSLVMQRCIETKSSWFGWAHVAHLGCIAAVVLQSYASLGEWIIFCGSLMAGAMLLMSRREHTHSTQGFFKTGDRLFESVLTMLMGFAAVAGLSISRAYAWNPMPLWLLLVLATLPSLMASVDIAIFRFAKGSIGGRLAGCLVVLGIVFALLYVFVLRTEPQW